MLLAMFLQGAPNVGGALVGFRVQFLWMSLREVFGFLAQNV